MNKLYWSGVAFTIIAGLAIVITFGLQGKTVPKIKWSHFANAQEVSDAVKSRLSQELKGFNLIFVGPQVDKPLHIEASANIVNWLRTLGPSVVIADPRLSEKNLLPVDVNLSLMTETSRFLEGLQKINPETRVIVWSPNIYVTHLLPSSPVSRMQADLQKWNSVVLSFMPFPASREEETDFELPCKTGETDATGFAELGCFIQGQARAHYRKEKIENKTPGFLNHVRTQEFMFFLGH